jgi:hypothetical protein
MATFYVGPRPVLKGQNTNEMVNPYTSLSGKAKGTGTYSYYPLYSTSELLNGAPDNHHVPGTGYFPGDVFLSQIFNGSTLYIHPLSGTFPDGTATYDGARFRPMEFKGLTGAKAFPSTFGHEERENDYKLRQYTFKGVASASAFANTGHAQRTDAQGAPASFGLFIPDDYQGVVSAEVFPAAFGQAIPTGYDNAYGKNKVQEWRGVASAKAL